MGSIQAGPAHGSRVCVGKRGAGESVGVGGWDPSPAFVQDRQETVPPLNAAAFQAPALETRSQYGNARLHTTLRRMRALFAPLRERTPCSPSLAISTHLPRLPRALLLRVRPRQSRPQIPWASARCYLSVSLRLFGLVFPLV